MSMRSPLYTYKKASHPPKNLINMLELKLLLANRSGIFFFFFIGFLFYVNINLFRDSVVVVRRDSRRVAWPLVHDQNFQ